MTWAQWPQREQDLAEAEAYANGGPSPSRRAMGRLASFHRSTDALLTGSRLRADLLEKMIDAQSNA